MKVLHVGNIANNAYNNAKFLRRAGIDASVLVYDYTHIMGQPEWEDAQFNEQVDEYKPRWDQVNLNGFVRPEWFHQVSLRGPPARQRFKGELRLRSYMARLARMAPAYATYRRLWPEALRHIPTASRAHLFFDCLRLIHIEARMQELFAGYDIIQAYATDPVHALLFASNLPYVAYEHGTMRDLPFARTTYGRLLALAYHKASKVIITNPDVITSARRLGLSNFVFVPHPIDEDKYRPRPSPLRPEIEARFQCDVVLLAPSRHNWAIKGNDRLVAAAARLIRETRSKLLLILCDWGQEVPRTRALISELGIGAHVTWVPPLNKGLLIDYYNAADIVLDQFSIGTFGTVTPEAMACAKPVVLHFDPAVHDWCYDEMPPVISARNTDDICARLGELVADPAMRVEIGARSRAWIEKHHGSKLVTDRQIGIYREILSR